MLIGVSRVPQFSSYFICGLVFLLLLEFVLHMFIKTIFNHRPINFFIFLYILSMLKSDEAYRAQ